MHSRLTRPAVSHLPDPPRSLDSPQRGFRPAASVPLWLGLALPAIGLLALACTGDGAESGGETPRAAKAQALALELPERIEQDAVSLLNWVDDELAPSIGKKQAETLLWTVPNSGSNTEDLGKVWLALEAIGRPPDRERFFQRCNRPAENQPEVAFVPVGTGSFQMGSPDDERGRSDAESPQREVRVPAFEIAATPITNAQYEAFDPLHARQIWDGVPDEELDDHPVVNVSWWDAFVFSRWLGARLPIEAEWEYACRAGTASRFWSGDSSADLERVGWFFDNAEQRTHPVGTKPANPWGLHDVHGLVFEWNRDTWHASYVGAPRGAKAWVDTLSPMYVYRGGAWNRYAEYARAAFRGAFPPTERSQYLGFRVARDGPP